MDDLILHHCHVSPNAEKIRLASGLEGPARAPLITGETNRVRTFVQPVSSPAPFPFSWQGRIAHER